ncbi:MAG TPA: alpha/beta hydrolase [Longimicrobiaceae bacterium]|nr:alpha/beta hydrolase [Longimicrobiaceae bacterium]
MTDWGEWGGVVLRGLRVALLAYAAFALLAWLAADRLMFQPQRAGYGDSPGLVRIPVDGDTLAAVWLPNPEARYAVLFSHGNAEDIGDDLPFLAAMRDAGFSVFAYDYRGYGLSTGRPSERRSYRDGAAAYRHLTGVLGVPPQRVIVHGRSLGGGVAAALASREPVAGLVLESTFTSVFGVSPGVRLFPFDRFRSQARLARVQAPVLVIHGTRDDIVPFRHGERLFRAAREPRHRLWVEGAGHNDLSSVAGASYWTALRGFAAAIDRAAS